MSNLFLRTLSQGLQAFTPIAVSFVWLRSVGAFQLSRAIRRALLVSIPVTVVAARLFQMSEHRALEELVLAAAALALAIIFAWAVWLPDPPPLLVKPNPLLVQSVVVAGVIIVVRQTMEIGALLETAAVELRSLDATSAVVQGATAAAIVGWLWTYFGRPLSDSFIRASTRAFALTFVGQLVLYSFHESAEARLLPYSEVLHTATESYGPDGIYGVHVSELLVLLPLAAIGWAFLRSPFSEELRRWCLLLQRRAALGAAVVSVVALMGMQRNDAPRPVLDVSASAVEIAASVARPHILFRNTAPGENFGKLSVAPLDALDQRLSSSLVCERVSFASGHGLCLHTDRGVFSSHKAFLFDQFLKPGSSIKLQGLPSRTRIARTGTVGAITVFVLGEDYGGPFSTRTTIVDIGSGDEIGELEQFTTWRDGARFRAVDFNFWGVTFSRDSNTFYASLRTAGKTYLVRGELALRRLTVVRDGVECPSLSPDGRLLGYKKRVGPSPDAWRLHVLDLETNIERMIDPETRYIDDQVEWLDSQRLLYAVPRRTTAVADVWVAPVDGTAPPRVFLSEASSPIVVR
jgi:hypothetical protein